MKAGLHLLICMGGLSISVAAHAGNTVISHPVTSVRTTSVRAVSVAGARGRAGVAHTGAFHPGGIYGNHGFYGNRGNHGTRGSYSHVWRHWGGSFHYAPVSGIYLGFYDNPWYWGYPVYYYGYPIYPYDAAGSAPANTGAAAPEQPAICGSWQLAGGGPQYQWVTAPCPLPKAAVEPAPASQATGIPKQ